MFAQTRVVHHFSLHLSPARIVIGYILVLFVATAGVVVFPFSLISLSLFFIVVGTFFVVAITVIVMAYLFMAIAVARALMGFSRRLLVGTDQNSGSQEIGKPCPLRKDPESQGTDDGLWDRWIDGFW